MTPTTRPRCNDAIALAMIALFTILSVTACDGGAPSANPGVQQGRVIFSRICGTCHGGDANGLPGLGMGLRDNEFTRSLSDAEMVEFLNKGRPASHPLNTTGVDMPPKGGDPSITDQDLKNLVAYLRTL